ncbi:hypothetical protein NQ176_g832 [Zarea fungicola]|uniref:Uncharacterized protein n=1 Tax=Zarea fungicola TaxID=93591 RepID=A0ACC1NWC5_9HYPO|nr:hypothetical protein NQ176_g832 [Lecanicillium fungicola]
MSPRESKPFDDLPPELRNAIWRLAIPRTTFYVRTRITGPKVLRRHGRCSISATPNVKHRNNLLLLCQESYNVFREVKRVSIFKPERNTIDIMGKTYKVQVEPMNLDPSYDMIDFSTPKAGVQRFAQIFPDLARSIASAAILYREMPTIQWLVSFGLPAVKTLIYVVKDEEERKKLETKIEAYQPVRMDLRVGGIRQPLVSHETIVYSRTESTVDSSDVEGLDFCGKITSDRPQNFM